MAPAINTGGGSCDECELVLRVCDVVRLPLWSVPLCSEGSNADDSGVVLADEEPLLPSFSLVLMKTGRPANCSFSTLLVVASSPVLGILQVPEHATLGCPQERAWSAEPGDRAPTQMQTQSQGQRERRRPSDRACCSSAFSFSPHALRTLLTEPCVWFSRFLLCTTYLAHKPCI